MLGEVDPATFAGCSLGHFLTQQSLGLMEAMQLKRKHASHATNMDLGPLRSYILIGDVEIY